MRGMIYRRRARDLIAANRRPEDARTAEPDVLDATELALRDFHRAQELEDDVEHGFVAAIQLVVTALEYGRLVAAADSFGEFLASPASAIYRQLLQDAEDALESIREIRAGDQLSRYAATAEAELRRVVLHNYSALLQGWRNLLDRLDVVKAPIDAARSRAFTSFAQATGGAQAATNDGRPSASSMRTYATTLGTLAVCSIGSASQGSRM